MTKFMRQKVITLLFILGICAFAYYLFFGSPIRQVQMVSMVEDHIENIDDTSGIEEINAEYEMKRGDFYVNVVYEDETNLKYGYLYNDRLKQIRLFRVVDQENGQRVTGGKNDSLENYVNPLLHESLSSVGQRVGKS